MFEYLSMSLGLRGFTTAFQAIVDALRANNVLPVFRRRDEGVNTSRSPGNYANVLSVGAMASDNTVADFSSSQQFNRPDNALIPDLVAPGVERPFLHSRRRLRPDGRHLDGDSTRGGAFRTPATSQAERIADELGERDPRLCVLPPTMTSKIAHNRGVPDAGVAFQRLTGQTAATGVGRRRGAGASSDPARRLTVYGTPKGAYVSVGSGAGEPPETKGRRTRPMPDR